MNPTVRLILIFLATVLTALAVTDPVGVPQWVQLVAGILATGFAAIGIPAGPVTDNRRNLPPL